MPESINHLIESLIDVLNSCRSEAPLAARGFRLVCQAPGHGEPRTYLGECRGTRRESRQDMVDHAAEFHGGSTAGMSYEGGCDLDEMGSTALHGHWSLAYRPRRSVAIKETSIQGLHVVDTTTSPFSIRRLTSRECDWLTSLQERLKKVQEDFHAIRPFADVLYGTCVNDSDEPLAVYGPKLEGSYDNSLYVLQAGQKTPRFWDCDGFFVPNDRRYPVGVGRYETGPRAVKVSDLSEMTVVTTRPHTYSASTDRGSLRLLRPGDVNWNMPDVSYRRIMESLPSIE